MHRAAVVTTCALLFASAAAAQPARIPVSEAYPAGVASDGAGGMWIAALRAATAPESENALVHLDAAGDQIARIAGGTRQELIFDGAGLWAIDFYEELQRLDLAGQATTVIAAGNATGAAWDPAGQRFWILQGGDSHDVWIVDATGDVAATLITEAEHTYWWGLAFDGCSLWTSDIAADTLIRLHPETGAVLETRDVDARAIEGLAFDGQVLLGSDTSADEIVLITPGPVAVDGVQCLPHLLTSPPAADFGTAPGSAGEGEGDGEPGAGDEPAPGGDGEGEAGGGLMPGDPAGEGEDDPTEPTGDTPPGDDGDGIGLGPDPLSEDPLTEQGGCACSGASLPGLFSFGALLCALRRGLRRRLPRRA